MDGVPRKLSGPYVAKNELRQQLPFQEANQVICRATAWRLPSGFGRNSAERCGKIDWPNPRRVVVNQTQRSCVEIRFGSHETHSTTFVDGKQRTAAQLVVNSATYIQSCWGRPVSLAIQCLLREGHCDTRHIAHFLPPTNSEPVNRSTFITAQFFVNQYTQPSSSVLLNPWFHTLNRQHIYTYEQW